MILRDTLTLDGIRRTRDGYLTATAKVARTGIQIYRGSEVDPTNAQGLRDRATVRVYRPETEVFQDDAIKSYAHRPITLDHPTEGVDASNWKRLAVGQTGEGVLRDGEFVTVPLVLMDAAAIAAVESGKRELSMGYTTDIVIKDGVTPDGQQYDAIQTQMRMNHLAIVSQARGGNELKIGDKGSGSMTTRTVMVDGLPVDLTDKDAAIVSRALADANKKASDAAKALADAMETNAKTIAAKDAELAKRDAEIADLKSKVLDAAALDKRVADRSALVSRAKALAPSVTVDGIADAEIKKAVVLAVSGKDAVEGKSAAYIDARFDMLTDGVASDPIRAAVAASPVNVGDARTQSVTAFKAGVANLNSWRDKKEA